jgi:hypothetical protein
VTLDALGLDSNVLDLGPCGICQANEGGCLILDKGVPKCPPFDGVIMDKAKCIEAPFKGTICKRDILGRLLQEDAASDADDETSTEETETTTTTTTTTTTPLTIGLFYNIETRGKNTWLSIVQTLRELKMHQKKKDDIGENLFDDFVENLELNFRAVYGAKVASNFSVTIISSYGEGNDAFKFFGTSFVQPPSAAYWEYGTGTDGYTKDDEVRVSAKTAAFNAPLGLAVDKANQLYVADSMNARVRRISIERNLVGTVAGEGLQYFQGDGGLGFEGSMNLPSDIAFDKQGSAYITDTNNHRIRSLKGLVFSPPCPNTEYHLTNIGVLLPKTENRPLGRSQIMQTFQTQILSRILPDYSSYEYVTNRYIDVNPIPIEEWINETKSQDTPIDALKLRTKNRNHLLFTLAINASYECGNCSRKGNVIITGPAGNSGCGSASEWALCSEDKTEPDTQDARQLRNRIAQHSGRNCIGDGSLNCDDVFCHYACDECLNPPPAPAPGEEPEDPDNSSNATGVGPTCSLSLPILLKQSVIQQFNKDLHFLDVKTNHSRWRCPRIRWNNGTGTRQGALVRDVLAEVMDEQRTPDHMLGDAIIGLRNGICTSTCGTSVCDNTQTTLTKDEIGMKVKAKSDALELLKKLKREKKATTTNENGEPNVEKTKYDDDPENGIFSVEEVSRTKADENFFKEEFAKTVEMYVSPVPDELSYDSSCRDLFFDWYADILKNCDGENQIGSKFYHRASQIPQRMFAQIMAQKGQVLASPCHPGCGMLHPDLAKGNQDCCGADGYLCQENEGNCDVDSDCADGLICGQANCIWNGDPAVRGLKPDNCCTQPQWDDNLMELRDLSLQIGWDQVQVWAEGMENLVTESPIGEKIFATWCGGCGDSYYKSTNLDTGTCTAGRRLTGDHHVLVPHWVDGGTRFNRTHNIVTIRNASLSNRTRSNRTRSNRSNFTAGRTRSRKKSRKPWSFGKIVHKVDKKGGVRGSRRW